MRQNQVLAKLRAGQPTIGFWMNTGSSLVAEFAARVGFDWILLDQQHGYWSDDSLLAALQVIAPTDTVPLVRVLSNQPGLIGKALDAGALGVVVPLVNSAAEATQAVMAARYPPLGARSAGGARNRLYGDDYFAAANQEILVALMIETREAAEHAAEIVAVPGVDVAFIGPGDLAFSLGTFGQKSALHESLIQQVLVAGQAQHVPVGIYCANIEDAIRRAKEGFLFVPCGDDLSLISQMTRDLVKAWRDR